MPEPNIRDKLKKTLTAAGDSAAFRHKRESRWIALTYPELASRIRALCAYLRQNGLKKGDRAALLMDNGPDWAVVFLALVSMGAVAVPLNTEGPREEALGIMRDAGCELLFTGAEARDGLQELEKDCPSLKKTITLGVPVSGAAFEKDPGVFPDEVIEPADDACVLYTSGTTAEPKGVVLTHGNLLSNCASLFDLGIVTSKDSVISVLPLHHAYPLTVTMLLPVLYGGTVVYPGTIRGDEVLEAMRETGVTVFVGVPRVYDLFYRSAKDALSKIPFPLNLFFSWFIGLLYGIRKTTGVNLSRVILRGVHAKFGRSLRFFVSGGAKLDENIQRFFVSLGFTFIEGYGLTETSPVLTINPPARPKIGSVGMPVKDVRIRIKDMDTSGAGEVLAAGPNIMKGYYKKKELTGEVIKDGWFHTGDLGYMDDDGYLFLTGRVKETIVLPSGKNIFPEEVERKYSAHRAIDDVCVFDVPQRGEDGQGTGLWAVVVPNEEIFKEYGAANLENTVREHFTNVSRSLPGYKRLTGYTVSLDELPRTLLGKVKRHEVREKFAPEIAEEKKAGRRKELTEEDKEFLRRPVVSNVVSQLREQAGTEKKIHPDDILEYDLGIDSLGRIELASGLERLFRIPIKDEVVGEAFTVRELAEGVDKVLGEAGIEPCEKPAKEAAPGEYWKDVLSKEPKDETLEKIDLKPGFVAWLGGFVFVLLLKALSRAFYSLRAEGAGNIPAEGPYIFYANHTSYLDGLLVAAALPRSPRLDLFFVGFRVYFDAPVVRRLVKIGRIIPLDFSSHFLEALRSSYYVLDKGKCLCLFPEGLRSVDGDIKEFKKGLGILAKETGAALVPVRIKGAFEAWPRTEKYPKRHPVKVVFGSPISAGEAEERGSGMGPSDSYEAISLAARKALIEL